MYMATKVQSFMTSQPTEVNFLVTTLNETLIVQVPARLSVLEAVGFKQTCQELTKGNSHPKEIIIDFQQTTFMDSSGLGALVSNFKTTKEKGIVMILRNVTPQVMAVLNLTGLDKVFSIEPSSNISPTEAENALDNQKVSTRKIEQLPTTHPSVASWTKRFLDIFGALVGLVITGILCIPIVIAIQIDNPAPFSLDKSVVVGWVNASKFGNFAPCVWMRKQKNLKSKTRYRVLFSRTKMILELQRLADFYVVLVWMNSPNFGMS